MKRSAIFLVFLSLSLLASAQDNISDYQEHISTILMLMNTKQDGFFRYTILPIPIEMAIIGLYPKWIEKRFDHKRILQEIAELKEDYSRNFFAFLSLSYTGSWDSKGKTQLDIPQDLAEYLFIENDAGDYLACEKADLPLLRMVGVFHDREMIALTFPSPTALLEKSQAMHFNIGGLGFKDTKFTFHLPISSWFVDAPEELKSLFIESGIW